MAKCPSKPQRSRSQNEIRGFADVNAPGRYHETLTKFWIKLVAHTRSVEPARTDFSAHLARYPVLLDKHAPEHHYSSALLGSPRARSTFVEPDLRPLP